MDLRTTIALVSSRPDPTVYGTGFVIHADATRSYIVTCAHVIRDIHKKSDAAGDLLVDHQAATIEAIGTPNTIDLAVLSVPRLVEMPPLPLTTIATEGAAVEVYGLYMVEKKSAPFGERLQGTLYRETIFSSTVKVRSFRLKLQDGDRIQPGYSGGPVVCDGQVIGVATIQRDQGSEAIAIMVEAVAKIWPEMPPGLLSSAGSPTVAPLSTALSSTAPSSPAPSPVAPSSKVSRSSHVESMDWNKDRKKEFRKALQKVYGDYARLKIFIAGELGENLPDIVGDQTMVVACFELVEWADAKGRLDELFVEFCQENPKHPLAGNRSADATSTPEMLPEISPETSVSPTLQALDAGFNQQKLQLLTQQYQAVSQQLLTETNAMMRPILEAQRDQIAAQIRDLDQA